MSDLTTNPEFTQKNEWEGMASIKGGTLDIKLPRKFQRVRVTFKRVEGELIVFEVEYLTKKEAAEVLHQSIR